MKSAQRLTLLVEGKNTHQGLRVMFVFRPLSLFCLLTKAVHGSVKEVLSPSPLPDQTDKQLMRKFCRVAV